VGAFPKGNCGRKKIGSGWYVNGDSTLIIEIFWDSGVCGERLQIPINLESSKECLSVISDPVAHRP
jgi:hypothetical protein